MDDQQQLIDIFANRFIDGGSFKTIVEARQLAATVLGSNVAPGTAQAKLVDEAVEQGLVRAARSIVQSLDNSQSAYDQLVDLYQRQPTLGTRSSTSVAQQAYTTPVPIAFLAATLARVDATTTVYEPTAGNGMLLLTADPTQATVNELNKNRAADLKAQGFLVTQVDATVYTPFTQHDVVIANPPFGSVMDEMGRTKRFSVGPYTTTQIDHVIALKALTVMKPEGRAALILGGKLGEDEQTRSDRYNTQMSRAFYYTLYNNYNVTGHFSIWGDLYRRQGAGFPIDVILIEGRGKSQRPLPAADVPRIYHSFAELKELLPDAPLLSISPSLGSLRLDGAADLGRSGASRSAADLAPGVAESAGPASGVVDATVDGRPASQPEPDLPNDRPEVMASRDVPVDSQPGQLTAGVGSGGCPQQQRSPGVDQFTRGRVSGTRDHRSAIDRDLTRHDYGGREPGRVAPEPEPLLSQLSERDQPWTQRSEAVMSPESTPPTPSEQPIKQVPYTPRSQGQSVDTLVPVNMQAAIERALATLEQRVGPIDQYVADRLSYGSPEALHQHLSAEQIDASALALNNLEKGSGLIVGDQTGIGKGRIVATMIRYAKQTGRTPIFVTQNPTLYADMLRDIRDIGMENFRPFCTNAKLDLPLPDGRRLQTTPKPHQAELERLRQTGTLEGYDAIFTTYSQLQTVKGEETNRRAFLRQFSQGSVLILDESHEAGGSLSETRKPSAAPNRAEFIRDLVERADGVFYSSATYAKRTDVMDLYSKTDMRLAVSNMEKLVGMVEQGGVPLQQALAAQLVEAGQYIRRERSFEGVHFEAITAPVDHQVGENISAIMSSIMEFDQLKQAVVKQLSKDLKAEAKAVLGDASTGDAGASSTNFTSIMHNLIDQSLLAMKAEETVQQCLTRLRQPQPEKPLIALSSTMGSFIGSYAQLHSLKPGDPINVDFGNLLRRYLERSRDVLVGDAYGEKTRHRLSDAELGPQAVAAYEQVVDLIEATDFSQTPISPIDYIKARLNQEGYRVNEITGRQDIVEYASDGSTTYDRRTPKEVSKAAAIRHVQAFNDGHLDVIILNRSGSTGISLHASDKFADQRPRHMIVAQAERDINTFMQMLGRIHRTGQVVKPSFTLLMADIPAEKRPGAVLCKKLASLNANTTAARKGGIALDTVPDFMNSYGDQIAAEVMENHPSLHYRLGEPLKGSEEELVTDNAISRVTGRIPLLPIAEQEKVYGIIEREYTEFVQRQETMGESILEAGSLDLDARTHASVEVLPSDPGSESPFTSAVNVEVMDVKTLRKPLTTLEAINVLRRELKLPDAAAVQDHDYEAVAGLATQIAEQTAQALKQATRDYCQEYLAKPITEKGAKKFQERLGRQLEQINHTLTRFPVGQTVQINTAKGNVFYGVVARAWCSRGEGRDNPATPATWKMQFLLADPARELTLPFSKLNVDRAGTVQVRREQQDWLGMDIYERFDAKQGRNREERQVFTGNILRAYEKFEGKLINFTDHRGQIRQGLIAPQGFDIEEKLEKQPVVIPTARRVVSFINDVTEGKGVVKSLDELVVLKAVPQRQGGGFVLQVPKARDAGGQYYLNPDLIQAAGSEFYSVGDRMELRVPSERIETLLGKIQDQGVQWAAFDKRDQAREFLGIELPQLEMNQPDRGVTVPHSLGVPVTQAVSPVAEPSGRDTLIEPKNIPAAGKLDLPVQDRLPQTDMLVDAADPNPRVIAPPEHQRGGAERHVAALLNQAGLSETVLQGDDFHSQIKNEPFIPLVIERHSHHLYLTHYLELNGDLCLDAEMVFQIGNTGALALKETAVADPNRGGEYRRCDRGFAQMFSQNLLHQGFAEAALQAPNAATEEPQPQSGSQSVDPASTVRNSEADAPSQAQGMSVASEAQTTPAQLGQTDTAIERLPDGSKSPVSAVPTHTPSIPSEKEVSQLVVWQQVARALNRPDDYLNRIKEITQAYRAGEPLSPEAASAMGQDVSAHEQALSQLRDWHRAAKFLGYSDRYQQRIVEVANAFKAGTPVSERAIQAMSQDLSVHQRKLEALGNWQKVARAIGQPEDYCARITKVVETCKAGCPLSDRAKIAMRQDWRNFLQNSGKAAVAHEVRKPDIEIGD